MVSTARLPSPNLQTEPRSRIDESLREMNRGQRAEPRCITLLLPKPIRKSELRELTANQPLDWPLASREKRKEEKL